MLLRARAARPRCVRPLSGRQPRLERGRGAEGVAVARRGRGRMRSYPLHIGGRDVDGTGWTYVAHSSALIRDGRRAFSAKRAMELGRETTEEDRALLAGRCAVGS